MKRNIIRLSLCVAIFTLFFTSCVKDVLDEATENEPEGILPIEAPEEFDIEVANLKSTIAIRINDVLQTLPSDQQPTIINSRTMLPMNWVFTQF